MSKFTEAYPVSTAPPAYVVASAPPIAVEANQVATREYLNTKNWPKGLISYVLKSVNKVPYHFFICDDSGSMATSDGKRLEGTKENIKVVSCNRWTEMTQSLKFHASLAQALDIPCEFRMLNSAPPYVIGGPGSDPSNVSKFLDVLSNNSPGTIYTCKVLVIYIYIYYYYPILYIYCNSIINNNNNNNVFILIVF